MIKIPYTYSAEEERLNAWTHGLAAILAILGTIFLLVKAVPLSWQAGISMLAYGLSLILLFSASTLYHLSDSATQRIWLKKLDHTAIYYLIAGTYTPFLALFLPTEKAKILLIALWIIALIGTFFKLFFVHRFQKISLIAYIVMGWLAVLVMDDMRTYLSSTALQLLIAGGLFYTIGTIFYAAKKYKYTHAIWHIFVVMGAASHFFAIWSMLNTLSS
ncbi:hemolysin III family protein [Acinetobacter puyangensis]|uniref:Hemolysin III n=1 Tax=Acinetobacter puyangensis TaxID=1096779 RepID=A0A240E4F1_9GAMM|nr:hemolysin III family protein [Acinetobacter puyangensis]SNX43644.1 hemolysin III [Acinetobacter puyangensis]